MQDLKGICAKQFRSLNDYHLKEIFWALKPMERLDFLTSSSIFRISSEVKSAYDECRAMGSKIPFTFSNYLTICWNDTKAECCENDLKHYYFKSQEDHCKEQIVISYLQERYPGLIVDKLADNYQFFFNKADYSEFEDWCKLSNSDRIDFRISEEVLGHAKMYGDVVKVSLYDVHVYSNLYRIMSEWNGKNMNVK